MRSRQEIVRDLALFQQDLSSLTTELNQYPWDCPTALYEINRHDLASVIRRCLVDEVTLQNLEDWANKVECRDDLSYSSSHLEEIVLELANPVVFGPLTKTSLLATYERVLNG